VNADQFYAECVAEADKAICDAAVQVANAWLAYGVRIDDLPDLMRDFVRHLAVLRSNALARARVHAERLRQLEAIEAQFERQTATVH
jgi:hypothetical protein